MSTLPSDEPCGRPWLWVALIMALVAAALFPLCNSWMFSCIGDEWGLYQRATNIVAAPNTLPQELFGPLSAGLWGVHKPFLTALQGLALYAAGMNNFTWRAVGVGSFILSIPPFFILSRLLLSQRSALLACAFMSFSYYLLAEALWGYGWTMLRLFSLWHAAFLGLFLKRPSALRGIGLGVSLTGCSLAGALCAYIPPLTAIILLGFCVFRFRERAWRYSALVLVTYLLTHTLPIQVWSRSDDFKTTLRLTLWKTSLGPLLQQRFGKEIFPNVEGKLMELPEVFQFASARFVETLTAPYTLVGTSHHIYGKTMHPVIGALAVIGSILAVGLALRSWGWRLVLLFYLPAVILAGALTPTQSPPITRVHFLVPFWALFAATTLDFITRRLPRAVFILGAVSLLGVSAVWTYDRLFVRLPKSPHFTAQAHGMQIVQAYPGRKIGFLYGNWHPLEMILEPYGLSQTVLAPTKEGSAAALSQLSSDPTALVVLPPGSKDELETVRAAICKAQPASECACKPCGGRQDLPLFVCGRFTCVLEQAVLVEGERYNE